MKSAKVTRRIKRTFRVTRVKAKWFFKRNLRTTRQRFAAGGIAAVFLATLVVPLYLIVKNRVDYKLSDSLWSLVGDPAAGYDKKLTLDSKENAYVFNAESIGSMSGDPIEQLQAKVGGGAEDNELLYGASISRDPKKGATYYDTQLEISFTLTPRFSAHKGQQSGGHVVFPLKGYDDAHLIYTLKSNGVKEDILLSEFVNDEMEFGYDLELPGSLQAKILDDGSLGVYSADPTLFGSISFGSDADREKVEAARQNGDKTHLAFVIPKPVIYETVEGQVVESEKSAGYFSYEDGVLTVHTRNLSKANYPLSIDPSVVVTSTEDFTEGNSEDNNIVYDSGAIRRADASGGSFGAWTATSSFATARSYTEAVAYNGYMYIIGGSTNGNYDTPAFDDVQYAPINSNGTLGSWTATSSMTIGRSQFDAVAYNGYIYAIGGFQTYWSTELSSVEYAKINPNGTLGSWQTTTSMPGTRNFHEAVAYNGYIYAIGGFLPWPEQASTSVNFAPIKADGTLGSWTSTASLGTIRVNHAAVVYNGYIYAIGGNNGSTNINTTEYAKINSDGTLSSWTAGPSMVSSYRSEHAAVVHNGYLYAIGGVSSSSSGQGSEYALINANGTLGAWTASSVNFSGGLRQDHASVAYNGYLYTLGTNYPATTTVVYAAIHPAGVTSGYTAGTTFNTGRYDHTTVAYNGYLYVLGGSSDGTNSVNTTRYAAINNDGTLGTWNSTTNLPSTLRSHAAVAYNGRMYVIGGYNGSSDIVTVSRSVINTGNGTLGSWSAMNSLNTARRWHTAVVANGYLYAIGGSDTSLNDFSTVEYAQLNTDGTLGTWATTTALSSARRAHASVAYDGKIYVLGGTATAGATNISTVEYATVNSNGTLGGWTSTTGLTAARRDHAATIYNGYLYVLGGTEGGSVNTVQFARVNSDGTLGSWSSTTSLSSVNRRLGAVAYNGFMYIAGGYTGSYQNTTQYARINSGGPGTTGSYGTTTALPTPVVQFSAFVHNGYMYQIGGENNFGDMRTDVNYAPINSNGTLGSWSATTSLPFPQSQSGVAVNNNYVYVVGGLNLAQAGVVLYAPINSNGTIGSWSTTTTIPGGHRHKPSALVYNGYIYAAGGWVWPDCFTAIYYAPINSNGTLGSWNTTTAMPQESCSGQELLQHDGYFYLVGFDDWEDTFVNIIYRATPNPNGTIGSWEPISRYAGVRRGDSAIGLYDGRLYIAGGYSGCCTNYNIVEYASFTPNGYLSEWNRTVNLPNNRDAAEMLFYNGYMYQVGGWNPNEASSEVNYATINSAPRKSTYSKLVDLGSVREISTLSFTGSGGQFTLEYKAACSDEFSASTVVANAVSGSGYTINETAQYVWVRLTIDDTYRASAPENGSTISDITVNYTTNQVLPEFRLRQGTHFSNEVKQGLDTSGDSGGGGGSCT